MRSKKSKLNKVETLMKDPPVETLSDSGYPTLDSEAGWTGGSKIISFKNKTRRIKEMIWS